MATITDEQMTALLSTFQRYSLALLKPGANRHMTDASKLIWEHGRRNLSLRADGVLSIVCPVESSTLSGLYIFRCTVDEATQLMQGDPAVQAGVFVFEVHPCKGFPGDALS